MNLLMVKTFLVGSILVGVFCIPGTITPALAQSEPTTTPTPVPTSGWTYQGTQIVPTIGPSTPGIYSTTTIVPITQTLATPTPVVDYGPQVDIPAGFRLIDSAWGVSLYRKDYPNGSPDFVQVLDLSSGARLELLHGTLTEPRPNKGSFGGPDPRMTSPALSTFWNQASENDPQAFCVLNGGFFYMPEYPTRLAFPLKVDGEMITEGWGIKTHVGNHLMLELWDDHANIQTMNQARLYASAAPDILGGLTEEANKRIKYAVGRTFVGIDDADSDGNSERVLLLTTRTALQSGAASVLRDFGADAVMMLDGGGSTQLLCKSGWHIQSDRPIPQAVAVIAGQPPKIAIEVVRQPEWPVIVVNESVPFEIEVRNTGTISWTHNTVEYMLKPSAFSVPYTQPVTHSVAPGETTVITGTLATARQPGVYLVSATWGVHYHGRTYFTPLHQTYVFALPSTLSDQRSALQAAVAEWKELPEKLLEQRFQDWINARAETPIPITHHQPYPTNDLAINPGDALWIPLIMFPIVILLGFMINRRNH